MSGLHVANLPAEPRAAAAAVADFVELSKLRITVMVAVTAALGYGIGVSVTASAMSWTVFVATMVGTCLSCIGAAVMNQVVEREYDAMMHRTRSRPLPAGRVSPMAAWVYSGVTSLLGIVVLAVLCGLLPALLAAFTIVSYVTIYTPLKRVTTVSTLIGAVPGALPPVIGYTAATGAVEAPAWCMFAIMFLWQVPHFLAIAWLYRDDYARGGFIMLPVIEPDGRSTFRQMLIGCLALVPLGLTPTLIGFAGRVYFVGALLCGIGFLLTAVRLVQSPTRQRARVVFFASLLYLPIVLALMVLDRT